MLQESDIIPYHLSRPLGERVLVLAPHPDDETLGCGGTLRLLVEAKKHVKVIFLTSGDKADPSNLKSYAAKNQEDYHPPLIPPTEGGKVPRVSERISDESTPPAPPLTKGGQGGFSDSAHITAYSLLREKEAEAALRFLGVSEYLFLRFPDRGIHAEYHNVLGRLLKVVEEFMPDTIYSPSMVELNPDHRAAAALSLEIQRARGGSSAHTEDSSRILIVFYEVTTPLRPNILVDVTSVYSRKKRAVKRYRSQLRLMDYLGHITALNTFRSLTVKGSHYVEAFWSVEESLNEEARVKWLSYEL